MVDNLEEHGDRVVLVCRKCNGTGYVKKDNGGLCKCDVCGGVNNKICVNDPNYKIERVKTFEEVERDVFMICNFWEELEKYYEDCCEELNDKYRIDFCSHDGYMLEFEFVYNKLKFEYSEEDVEATCLTYPDVIIDDDMLGGEIDKVKNIDIYEKYISKMIIIATAFGDEYFEKWDYVNNAIEKCVKNLGYTLDWDEGGYCKIENDYYSISMSSFETDSKNVDIEYVFCPEFEVNDIVELIEDIKEHNNV